MKEALWRLTYLPSDGCACPMLTVCCRGDQGKKPIPGAPYSQNTLRKREDMKSKLEEAILGTGNARTEMMMRRRQNSHSGQSGERGVSVVFSVLH